MFVGLGNSKDGVFVTVESDGTAMLKQVALQGFEVAERAFGSQKPQLHQRAGSVINEDEQGAGVASILEPSVIRTINLDQLSIAFTA